MGQLPHTGGKRGIVPGFWMAGITRRLQVHIWTRPRCQGALEWTNTLRDRCSHISGLLVKTFHSLRALMKSALPRLITPAASRALSLRRLGGSRSDRSCHQLDYTSHCAESFFIQLSSKIPVIMLDIYRLRDTVTLVAQRRENSPAPPSA